MEATKCKGAREVLRVTVKHLRGLLVRGLLGFEEVALLNIINNKNNAVYSTVEESLSLQSIHTLYFEGSTCEGNR